jgi:hypothetical protein
MRDHGWLSSYPTQTAARCDCLGEGVEANNAAIGIDGEIRRDKRVDEFIAAGFGRLQRLLCEWLRFTSGLCLLLDSRGILKGPVGIILDNDDVVLAAKRVDFLSPCNRYKSSGWVVPNTRKLSMMVSSSLGP